MFTWLCGNWCDMDRSIIGIGWIPCFFSSSPCINKILFHLVLFLICSDVTYLYPELLHDDVHQFQLQLPRFVHWAEVARCHTVRHQKLSVARFHTWDGDVNHEVVTSLPVFAAAPREVFFLGQTFEFRAVAEEEGEVCWEDAVLDVAEDLLWRHNMNTCSDGEHNGFIYFSKPVCIHRELSGGRCCGRRSAREYDWDLV